MRRGCQARVGAESRKPPQFAPTQRRGCVTQSAVVLTAGTGRDVLGRDADLAAIARFLAGEPSPAAALVLEGEAGIGKTTLWAQAIERAAALSYTVLSSRPAQSDEGLSFAGLGDLLGGVLERVLPELPAPQQAALEVALALAE